MRLRFSVRAPLVAILSLVAVACAGGEAPPPNVARPFAAPQAAGPIFYRLPVVGRWRVHRTHYDAKNDQAFALDLVIDAPMPRTPRNTDHPSYNQPVVADAPGVIATVVDGVPDNIPPAPNRYDMHGNYVVIDHQNGEFSLFAHLIPGSVRVRPGMFVAAGAEIGRCGNTGQSTAPHLHWQVMTHANANVAAALPPRYAPYERNGAMSTDLPQQGDKLLGPAGL